MRICSPLTAGFLAAAMVWVTAGKELAQDCPSDPRATLASALHLTTRPLKPRYFHDHSTRQIEAMRHQWYHSHIMHNPGLTEAEHLLKSGFKLEGVQRGKGGPVCVWVRSLEVEFSWTRMDVFVSSQYPRGSCPYRVILDHENQHVAINNRVFEKYRVLLRRALLASDIPTKADPMQAQTLAQAKAILKARINGVVDPLYDAFKRELTAENAVIDTPENYRRTQALCPQW